jgi:HAE1 family hydrophobic/amphiphilic exporter-1
MSSISGRFLYQFGITAAVAVLVSLLVSFTLTPMMSARMLRQEDAAAGDEDAHSRQGFYGWLDRRYERMLAWSMAHRVAVMSLAAAVIISSIPLYRLVRQEYIPTNVDEAEFDVMVTAPEGISLASIDKIMQMVEGEIRALPMVRLLLCDAGGGFLGQVNQGTCYVRIAPHDERIFSLGRFWRETLRVRPWAAFTDITSQRDVMQQVRDRLAKFPDLRVSVRNAPSFNIGSGNWDIDFVLRGPDLKGLADYADQLRIRSMALGIIDADTTLKLTNPELRVIIDRQRAADLSVNTEDIATALRLMVGGDTEVSRFIDPTSTKSTTYSCASLKAIAPTSARFHGFMCRAPARALSAWTTWSKSKTSKAHRASIVSTANARQACALRLPRDSRLPIVSKHSTKPCAR